MKFVRIVTAAAVVGSACVGLTPASAITPFVVGPLCGANVTQDPSGAIAAAETRYAELHGGPVVGYDAASPTDIAEVYLICTLQVGGTGYASDPDVARVEGEGIDFAVVASTPVTYTAAIAAEEFVCTEIWIATLTGHISAYHDEESGTWVADEAAARCEITAHLPLSVGATTG